MVLPLNIIAAFITIISRSFISRLCRSQPAVQNSSANIYTICSSIIPIIYYLLRYFVNSQTENQRLGDSSLAFDNQWASWIEKSKTWLNNNLISHSQFKRRERRDFDIEEAQPSTSGVANLKRACTFEDDDYPPSKLRHVDESDRLHREHSDHERHLKKDKNPNPKLIPLIIQPEIATLKINDEPKPGPSSACSLEEGEKSPQPKKHRGPGRPRKESSENRKIVCNIDLTTGLGNQEIKISVPKRHPSRRDFEIEEAEPSTSGVTNLKRACTFKDDVHIIYPPPKLRNGGDCDRLHHDHSDDEHSNHERSHHDHLHHEKHLKKDKNPNPKLKPLIIKSEVATVQSNDEPSEEGEKSPSPRKHHGPGTPSKESQENRKVIYNIDLTTQLNLRRPNGSKTDKNLSTGDNSRQPERNRVIHKSKKKKRKKKH